MYLNANGVKNGVVYILTLAAIVKELDFRNMNKIKTHQPVGVPLKWLKEQREQFRDYLMNNRWLNFKYQE